MKSLGFSNLNQPCIERTISVPTLSEDVQSPNNNSVTLSKNKSIAIDEYPYNSKDNVFLTISSQPYPIKVTLSDIPDKAQKDGWSFEQIPGSCIRNNDKSITCSLGFPNTAVKFNLTYAPPIRINPTAPVTSDKFQLKYSFDDGHTGTTDFINYSTQPAPFKFLQYSRIFLGNMAQNTYGEPVSNDYVDVSDIRDYEKYRCTLTFDISSTNGSKYRLQNSEFSYNVDKTGYIKVTDGNIKYGGSLKNRESSNFIRSKDRKKIFLW